MTGLFATVAQPAEAPIAGYNVGVSPRGKLDQAIAYLGRVGIPVTSIALGDCPIPRYFVACYPGYALACQVIGIAGLKGMAL